MRHACEQKHRSLRPPLRKNHRPPFGAGQRAQANAPEISSAKRWQIASMSLMGR